jgi:hypothetical protein
MIYPSKKFAVFVKSKDWGDKIQSGGINCLWTTSPENRLSTRDVFSIKKTHGSEMFFQNDSKKTFSSFLIATFLKNESCMMSKIKFW